MMNADWNLDDISTAFADAAADPERWGRAMDVATQQTGGFGAALFPLQGRLPAAPHSQSLVPSFDAYVRDGWLYRDERYRLQPQLERKSVITEFDFVQTEATLGLPYYRDFLGRFGLRWFAGVKVACGDDVWVLSIQRSIEQGPFSAADLATLAGLSPRLSNAAGMARMLGFGKVDAALEAFQISGTPALLIDRHGLVVRVNAGVESMLGPDLQIRQRRLVPRDQHAGAALDLALRQMLWSKESVAGPVVVPRANGRPIVAHPTLLGSLGRDILAPACIAITFVDLERRPVPADSALRLLFGLTGAEAKLAIALAGGEPLDRAADVLGIRYQTARHHLKAIFTKAQVERQSELVALVSRVVSAGPRTN